MFCYNVPIYYVNVAKCSVFSNVCMCSLSMFLLSVPAGVDMAFAYGASEEAFAAIAAGGSVVFPCGFVSADGTVTADPVWTQ